MSCHLQTILLGTFVPPDVPGRKIVFDDRSLWVATLPVKKRKEAARAVVIEVLQSKPGDWYSVAMVSAECRICTDTASKVLNQLASEHIVLKRRGSAGKRGGKMAIFKWVEKRAEK